MRQHVATNSKIKPKASNTMCALLAHPQQCKTCADYVAVPNSARTRKTGTIVAKFLNNKPIIDFLYPNEQYHTLTQINRSAGFSLIYQWTALICHSIFLLL